MRKKNIVAISLVLAGLSTAIAGPAFAQSSGFSGADCGWPTHAYLEIESTGTQYLRVDGTNGQINTASWPSSSTLRRNYTNSPTEDSTYGFADTSASSWFKAGWGCSV